MLSLYENEVKNSQLIIQHNPDLSSVDFLSQLDVSHLSIIKCVNLTSVSSSALSHLTIEDCSLSTLDNINTPNIQSLGLSKNSLQLNALHPLQYLRQLKKLNVSYNKITSISALRPLKQLTYLDLSNNELMYADPLIDLKQLANLRQVIKSEISNCYKHIQTLNNFKLSASTNSKRKTKQCSPKSNQLMCQPHY
ncbi:leucine-rich_repeat domain-containing protein [Hexamita inflata]|uniref:Leucine-rich repeat domain-containing protein n=1 Tax=Hexamita inflata TaxID=28002 RepID=A0AA86PKP2_9EUKA|nr:leucine-rich repeat domain-containing protein [Hexamita inflata]CAI9949031.1 leucine-rich repeat domain-containing protein [Hexamita inflata]